MTEIAQEMNAKGLRSAFGGKIGVDMVTRMLKNTIASTTGKSYDVVHKDVKKMIDKGYLKNAYIDEGVREVVLTNSVPAPQNNINFAAANSAPILSKIVACPCCGANNTMLGDICECEYCGSPLK